MSLSSFLSIVVIFCIILHVYTKKTDQAAPLDAESAKEENFYKLLEVAQHDNEDAKHLLHVKRTLESSGKSIPSANYKRMKMNVLKSLHADYLRRRTLYNEQAHDFDHVECGLRAIPVEVPYPSVGFSYPAFIDLHRCVGGCLYRMPSIIKCEVQQEQTVYVNTIQYDLHRGVRERVVNAMQNHTACGCECRVQAHHCDSATEIYDPDQCECVCKNLGHTCDPKSKEWNSKLCDCTCINPPVPCNNNNKLWSPETCDCQCLPSIKKRCKRKNKLLDPHTCSCYCSPDTVCEPGTVLHNYDCTCVALKI